MLRQNRPSVIAQPLSEREWQVVAGNWEKPRGGQVLGFIEELGGIYEVDIVEQPTLCQFVDTFKEAMDFFDALTAGSGEHDTPAVGAAC